MTVDGATSQYSSLGVLYACISTSTPIVLTVRARSPLPTITHTRPAFGCHRIVLVVWLVSPVAHATYARALRVVRSPKRCPWQLVRSRCIVSWPRSISPCCIDSVISLRALARFARKYPRELWLEVELDISRLKDKSTTFRTSY